jgi:hypothetical protein
MVVVRFDPKNKFADDILAGRKRQTIRSKPIEVGTKISLWEMRRGMKKWHYCPNFWGGCDRAIKSRYADACSFCGAKLITFPRKLGEAVIKECVPIEMNLGNVLLIRLSDTPAFTFIPINNAHCEFVQADTPSWQNRDFVNFFTRTYPRIKSEWMKFYIWKWE